MLVVGNAEQEQRTVSARLRDGTNLGAMPVPDLVERLNAERDSAAVTSSDEMRR